MNNHSECKGGGTAIQDQTPKTCLLAKLAGICLLSSILIIIAAFIVAESLPKNFEATWLEIFPILAGVAFAISPFLAIAALIRISFTKAVRGKDIAVATLIVGCFIWVIVSIGMQVGIRSTAYRMMCASNLSGLGKAMQAYANDYNEQIPTANKWCDLLIKYADISPRQFLCAATDTHIDESSYAMNKAAAGKRLIELPNDLVLLFETDFGKTDEGRTARTSSREFFADINDVHTANTEVYKDRWNQVGGPELLSIAHHKEGCLILYADGHVSFEMTRDLDQLRWVIDDSNFVFPAAVLKQTVESYSHRISWLYLGFGLIIAALGTITFFYRKGLRWWLVLTIVILATGPGALFGAVAENIYQSKQFTGLGVWGGAGLGVIFAFAFVPFVISTTQKYGVKQITMYMAAVGMITGILCSTVLHLMLMIAHAQTFPYGIIIGVPFGIMSGAILGYIAGVLLKKKINFATEIAEDTEKKL